jgi:cold shock CspA family protein
MGAVVKERGVVRNVAANQRFFFIRPDSGSDVFAHKSSLGAGVPVPCVGMKVQYELGERQERVIATVVEVLP